MRFPDDVPELTDGVITLRAHTPADAPRVMEQCTDPQSVEWTTVPTPYREEDAAEFVGKHVPQGWSDETGLSFAIEHQGLFAGSVDLRLRGSGEAEVGYGLHPDVRGQGVMRRALDLLLDWGFSEQNLVVVHWRANVGNWASRRAAWAVGFTFGPTIPRLLEQRGERRDGWTGWILADDPREPRERWLEPQVLERDTLRLRPWREEDGPRIVAAANDGLLRRFIPNSPLPTELQEVPDYLMRVHMMAATNTRLAWCVADRDTDLALGNVALFEFEGAENDETAQVGYWAHPEGRGRGVMSTAVDMACDWSMRTIDSGGLGLRKLLLLTAAGNIASRRVAERAHFVHVGTERESEPGHDSHAVYDRLRGD